MTQVDVRYIRSLNATMNKPTEKPVWEYQWSGIFGDDTE